mmetsp:Transcript_85743/g.223004  ORF Transcript_85743/g.223004 Transcript_85743/m.223004 type:complete len:1204 (-) Transcript_85743:112-3723(-)
MGIPRFYRWLSERYPLINENIAAEQIPDFDNLYLDMNGIIHNCSHNNTGGLCVKEESDVFVEAFKYITRLFNIIRPKKLLYMAVDGCAPRAKMNQQRSRRFRAANEAREAREQAESHGEVITGTQFDSNCITPGTEFMSKLTEHLRFFVCMKIQEDPLWQDVTVVLSGPDEPGEGEHKIMDYIRTSKAQPGYAANLRHCLYGLDADLIMLALASHEPHFALLREEVVFGKRVTEDVEKRTVTSKDRFQLLHVSLLREYLELEFKPPQGTPLPFVFNLERLIDDVILFCVLVGNDFLPSLPFAEIGEGGLDDFFTVYKEHLDKAERSHPPWLTYDCGKVDFEQVARFLWRYSLIEERKMEGAVEDGNWLLGKRRTMGPAEAPDPPEGRIEGPIECVASADEARLQYYQVKFGMDVNSHAGTQQRRKLFQAYLEGMQWVMLYYYRGPNASSWSWYYPFYHAPMAVDMADYDRITCPDVSFDVGEPFRPFQQLMAVLPSNSKILLPECFRWLFDSPSSPILDFYPQKFEIDMDGVKVPWGGVTLIPWIEEKRLVSAMAEAESRGEPLSEKEDRQNSFGPAYGFRYDRGAVSSVSSPMPHRFKSLLKCPVRMSVFKHPPLPMGMAHFINNVLPGFKRNASGFPTLHMHPLSCTFETGVKVFQFESRGKSLIVRLRPETGLVPAPSELQRLLRAPCARVDYPFAHRGRVVAVHTADVKYLQGGQTVQNNPREHEALVRQLTQDQRRKGLALDFGPAAYLNSGAGDAAAGAGQGRRGGHSSADETWLLPLAEVKLAEASYIDAEGRRQHSFQASGSELRLLHLVREEGEDEEALRGRRPPQRCSLSTTLRFLQAMASVQAGPYTALRHLMSRVLESLQDLRPHQCFFLLQAMSRLRIKHPKSPLILQHMSLAWRTLPPKKLVKAANAVAKLDLGGHLWAKPLKLSLWRTLSQFSGKHFANLKAITVIELLDDPEALRAYLDRAEELRGYVRYSRHLRMIEIHVHLLHPELWESLDDQVRLFLQQVRTAAEQSSEGDWPTAQRSTRGRRRQSRWGRSRVDSQGANGSASEDEASDSDSNSDGSDNLGARRKPVFDRQRFSSALHEDISRVLSGCLGIEHHNKLAAGPLTVDMCHVPTMTVVEAAAPWQFYARSPQMTALARRRQELLRAMGFKIVRVPYHRWESLDTDDAKVEFLRGKLPAELLPAVAAH